MRFNFFFSVILLLFNWFEQRQKRTLFLCHIRVICNINQAFIGFLGGRPDTFPEFCQPPKKQIMFGRLKDKWKVNGWQLTLILCTFSIGGSATGWAGKRIMNLLSIEMEWLWATIYIIIMTILWPLMVLLISIPFGQFTFFRNYIQKLGEKFRFLK